METLRSLRHVFTRMRKPGSARRAPVATAVRVLATSGVLISALALVGVGAAEAATGGHASSGSHATTHVTKAHHAKAHGAKTHGAKTHAPGANLRKVAGSPTVRPGPWLYAVFGAKGPWLY